MRTPRCPLAFFLPFALSMAAGCAAPPDPSSGNGTEGNLPEAAIAVGDDLYQVPAGRDDEGCRRYRLYSRDRMTVAAIFYRRADGGFTMNRAESACAEES